MAMTSIPALHYTKYDPARRGKGTKLGIGMAGFTTAPDGTGAERRADVL